MKAFSRTIKDYPTMWPCCLEKCRRWSLKTQTRREWPCFHISQDRQHQLRLTSESILKPSSRGWTGGNGTLEDKVRKARPSHYGIQILTKLLKPDKTTYCGDTPIVCLSSQQLLGSKCGAEDVNLRNDCAIRASM